MNKQYVTLSKCTTRCQCILSLFLALSMCGAWWDIRVRESQKGQGNKADHAPQGGAGFSFPVSISLPTLTSSPKLFFFNSHKNICCTMSASAGTGVFVFSLMSIPICYSFNSLITINRYVWILFFMFTLFLFCPFVSFHRICFIFLPKSTVFNLCTLFYIVIVRKPLFLLDARQSSSLPFYPDVCFGRRLHEILFSMVTF